MNKFTNITDALKWRYATSQFADTKISDAELTEILEAGNLAATAYGLQPFKFVVLEDNAKKGELVPHSWGQEHVAKNSHLIVLAIDTKIDAAYINEYADRIMTTRNLPAEKIEGYRNMMLGGLTGMSDEARNTWASKQAYIALGTMMAKASEMGIDNHALEGFSAEEYDKALGLSEKNLHAVVILAVGHRSSDDAWQHLPKVRKDLDVMTVRI